MSCAKCLPRFIAEKQRSISTIDGKTFTHGLKQCLVEGIKRRELRLELLERGQLPMQTVRCWPAAQFRAGLRRLERPIMRADGVAQLLQPRSDFAVDNEKIFQLRDGRSEHARNQQRSVRQKAVKI